MWVQSWEVINFIQVVTFVTFAGALGRAFKPDGVTFMRFVTLATFATFVNLRARLG